MVHTNSMLLHLPPPSTKWKVSVTKIHTKTDKIGCYLLGTVKRLCMKSGTTDRIQKQYIHFSEFELGF